MTLSEAIASLRHGDFVRVKLTGDRIVQGEVRREGDSFVVVGDMLLIRRDHPNEVITDLHILRRATPEPPKRVTAFSDQVPTFSDQAITDYYEQARLVGYREGHAAAIDAVHGVLDDLAEKFGVKTDAGIMRQFHKAIDAVSGDAK